MSKEYIPVVTNDTVYFKPQTKEEMDSMIPQMKLVYAYQNCTS